jgi:predicted phage terminase large subunit-like protein
LSSPETTPAAGYEAYEDPKSSSKAEAARPWSAAAANGNVFVVRAPWNDAFFDEVEMFPHDGYHDDQVDAVSGGFNWLHGFAGPRRGGLRA